MPRSPQVLLVEDSDEDAGMVASTLRNGGLTLDIVRVETLEALTDQLRRQHWDVVISDYSLQGFTARDVIAAIKTCCPDTAVIVTSGSGSEDLIVEIVKLGARDYVMKGNLTRLPIAVEREIRETEQHRQKRGLEEQLRHAQRLESLGVLAGGVAHDFNNILTGILGNASLATEILLPDSQAMPLLEAVVSAAEHAAVLTRQLLAYAGKGQHFVEQIDLSDLVRSCHPLLRVSVPRNIKIGLELAAGLPPIAVDRGQIEQVLLNLVINAAEAIGARVPGSITIRTSAEQLPAGPLAGNFAGQPLEGGEYVCLEVSDTGPGIPEDVEARMFDPFFTTKFTGRGLGLSAALGVIRAHGGALVVRTKSGEGAAFAVYLPAGNGAARPHPDLRNPVGALSGLVLVIDDEEIVRKTAQTVLQQRGLSVVTAENGLEGVELFRKIADRVALVLLDLTMPVLNGDATFRALREIRPDIPVLICSGYTEQDARAQMDSPAGVKFLQKPYGSVDLARAVQQAMNERSS